MDLVTVEDNGRSFSWSVAKLVNVSVVFFVGNFLQAMQVLLLLLVIGVTVLLHERGGEIESGG